MEILTVIYFFSFCHRGIFEFFEPESLAIFARNTQKYSQINYSKIAQKDSIFITMTLVKPQMVQL